jgi:NADH-quinone oxidoreductase subunit J
MADDTSGPGRSAGPAQAGPDPLAGLPVRLGALFLGLFGGLGAAGYSLASGHGIGLGLMALLYLCTLMLVWGFQGLGKKTPPSLPALLVIAAAVYGVLFLVGYLLLAVAGPVALEALGAVASALRLSDLLFYAFAGMTLAGGAGCAFSRNIIYSAWSLLFAFMGVAGLYVFLGADFPAVAQVLIYVGGILVLILFAVMLTRQIGVDPELTNVHVSLPVGGALALFCVATLCWAILGTPWKVKETLHYASTAKALGRALLTDWLLPFEVASVVLLAALVGAVVIARKESEPGSEGES